MDFGNKDVLFNIHGYDRFDNGLVEESLTNLMHDFPGETFAVSEPGYAEKIYGIDSVPSENIFYSEPYSGEFKIDYEFDDPDIVVVAGGELGSCLRESYNILQDEFTDSSFVLPPSSCYGYQPSANPNEHLIFTLEDVLTSNYETFSTQVQDLIEPLKYFDWTNTSLRLI